FTLLRLAPALIWEGHELPAPFVGSVTGVQENGESGDSGPVLPTTAPSDASPPVRPTEGDSVDVLLDLLGTPNTTRPKSPSATEEHRPAPECRILESAQPPPSATPTAVSTPPE